MEKSIEQIRETNFRNEKRRKERLDFVRNILKKNDWAISELEREGVDMSEIVRIINRCEGSDITVHEVECVKDERDRLCEQVFLFVVIIVYGGVVVWLCSKLILDPFGF
jgi:hypothetical protein